MLAGSVIGVPGPVATTRPPWTWRLSTAVGGRYRPTLVRSSPSSGAMSTRSPTTIRRLGDSSGMGSIIHPRAPAGLAHGGNGDVDHVHRLTGLGAALLMRPCRRGSRGPHFPSMRKGHRHANPDWRGPDGAVELDSPDGMGLDLERPDLDRRLAGARVPNGGLRGFLLADRREGLVALLPGDGAGLGRLGHVVLALHHSVPFRSRTLSGGAAHVLVGRSAHGVVLLVFVGSIWGLLRLGVGLFWRTVKSLVMSPFAMLDSSSRQPGVPWIAFVLLLFWSAIEATIFTFTLRPTMSELLSDLTGYQVNALALVVLLWFFLFIIIGGSFACIQVLNEAIQTRAIGQIVSMVLVELAVALFEVLFLYRELIDAITPWLAQQGFQLGIVGTLGLALLGWVGVRGMTWFLFGRFGTPALLAILGRKAMEGVGAVRAAATADAEYWRGPINALKAEHEWFKKEAQHLMELLTLPVLQLVAGGFNFLVVVIMGKPHFNLPFRSLDQVLHSTPIFLSGKTSTVEGGAS